MNDLDSFDDVRGGGHSAFHFGGLLWAHFGPKIDGNDGFNSGGVLLVP